ncbi:flagellin, partial [Poseidonibacter sp.]|uniref:flagellin n=1 Tax=Poseidonibacter sp. TaxID=2321188 RepID=UPI003C74A462
MQINNNSQLNQNTYLNANQALNKISSAVDLNKASDNPAGLAIANDLIAQGNSDTQAIENTNSAIAYTQIADGATKEQSNILDNVKEKLLQASTATTNQDGREAILKDVKALLTQFNDIASNTTYNEKNLLQNASDDKSATQTQQFQTGSEENSLVELSGIQSNTQGLGLDGLLTQDEGTFDANTARGFLDTLDNASTKLGSIQSDIGSVQNELQSANRNLITQRNQTLEANSVFDTDYA